MKNVILLNNRSLHLYDFKELKNNCDLRISAVVFDTAYNDLSNEVKESLDEIHILPDIASDQQKFPAFPEDFLCSLIEKEQAQFKDTWIVAADELNNLTASFLRNKYNLPGTTYPIILNYRNKTLQKNLLNQSGICIPRFMALERKDFVGKIKSSYKQIVHTLNLPFIIKPNDMFGTIGVEKIKSYKQFYNYLNKFFHFSNFIVEEFIYGQLYHYDFIIKKNEYIFTEVSEYLHNGLSFLEGYNHGSLLVTPDDPIRSSIIKFCKKANALLGIKSGCGHFEVFVTKEGEIVFLEAAARPAGSMVPLVFTRTFQKNYLNAAFLAEINENPGIFYEPIEYYFWSFFPRKLGIISSFNPPPLKSPYSVEWFIAIGDILHKPSSIAEKAGILLAKNKNYKVLKADFYLLRNFMAVEVDKLS